MNAHPDSAAFAKAAVQGIPLQDRVILALDVPTVQEAELIVSEVGSHVSFFKIGLQLQYHEGRGIDFARRLADRGKKVFLDSKLFDIGNTVERTVENIAQMGVDFLTVHGDRKVIQSAAKVQREKLKILAVTVLTSLDQSDLEDMGLQIPMEDFVSLRAKIAIESGADGVIASGLEASVIRKLSRDLSAPSFTLVTPGIRPSGTPWNDQRRVATPEEAITNGADYLVVGRPVLNAPSKIKMLESIFREVEAGLSRRAVGL
ncbi:orotidine-5'-phosphate decarboxylase [Bradyrhizobium sp. SRS-191]|uniref:orotidine-5'-phosphate decarboxylase n=1 Tax=Bradyrhizobium sp. SRS-191 TaxID=2962606 RepID=UPI00211E7EF6|nr:orotidine-5'-phosphate decarboxylase [Bradyrhizobium sp. SRS-191]